MCNGPLAGKLLLFAIPLMLSSILQLLFNAADVIVVGKFAGSESLAAVGSTSALINLMTNLSYPITWTITLLVHCICLLFVRHSLLKTFEKEPA